MRTIMYLLIYGNPLKWFHLNQLCQDFRPIFKLASVHLAMCKSSAFQESAFSSAKANMNDHQTRMSSERFGRRCVLYHNKRFIDKFVFGAQK